VVEKSLQLREDGYMMDFFGAGYDVAERMGLLPELENIHYPIPYLSFLDRRGCPRLNVSYAHLRKLFNDRHFNFMRGEFEQLLYARAKDGVEIRFGTTVEKIQQHEHNVTVTLSDGSEGTYDLVVGADGIHSGVRSLAFGNEQSFYRYLGYYAAAFILDEPPAGLQCMNVFSTLTVPGRQVGVYPIRAGRLATFFMHKAKERIAVGADIKHLLQQVYGGMDWIVPELLEQCPSSNIYFDEVSQIELPCWSSGRIVLVGDACQCVSLIAGQGASMAVTGAYVLADELRESGDDTGTALIRYEARMKPSIEKKQQAGRNMATWFVPDSSLRIAIRNLVMRSVSFPIAGSFLKRIFAADETITIS
ncbi:MAG: FAD-dependent monooxygenase, partial [Planctomycetales bacterium]